MRGECADFGGGGQTQNLVWFTFHRNQHQNKTTCLDKCGKGSKCGKVRNTGRADVKKKWSDIKVDVKKKVAVSYE